jgi:cytochrome c553
VLAPALVRQPVRGGQRTVTGRRAGVSNLDGVFVGSGIMNFIGVQWTLAAAIVAIWVAPAGARDRGPAAFSNQDLQEKIVYCKTCHGLYGQGYRGYYSMPRLAGQQTQYFEDQLQAFVERRRADSTMFNVARVLSPAMLTALATHFRDLDPKPLGGASKELVAMGKAIYEEGVPEANVAPCSSCRGPEAKGDGAFPRLAGQLHDYIFASLVNWKKERRNVPAKPDKSAIMEPIAQSLTETQISAVAAYLSYLE